MQSLYITPVSMRNHPSQSSTTLPANTNSIQWQEILLRFLSLLIPALLGSLVVSAWLGTLAPGNPLETEPVTLSQPKPSQTITIENQTSQNNTNLLPAFDSLDGLFTLTTRKKPWKTIPPEPQPNLSKPNTLQETTNLESAINQALLNELEPMILTRDQKQLLINSIPSGYPVTYLGINSPFGYRTHPTLHGTRFHPGVDLQAPMNTQVLATADGVVEFAGVSTKKASGLNGFGKVITLQHNFGFRTSYSHLSQILIKPGDFVKKGTVIGLSGQSGIATAPHLHYEIRFITRHINPSPFMQITPEYYAQLFQEKSINWKSLVTLISQRVPKNPLPSPLRMALR